MVHFACRFMSEGMIQGLLGSGLAALAVYAFIGSLILWQWIREQQHLERYAHDGGEKSSSPTLSWS